MERERFRVAGFWSSGGSVIDRPKRAAMSPQLFFDAGLDAQRLQHAEADLDGPGVEQGVVHVDRRIDAERVAVGLVPCRPVVEVRQLLVAETLAGLVVGEGRGGALEDEGPQLPTLGVSPADLPKGLHV